MSSWKETELHHRNAVNQNLRAGQRVRVTDNATNEDIHWKEGEFVRYIFVDVEVDGCYHFLSINSVEAGGKDMQRLERGDRIRVKDKCKKPEIRGKTGRLDRYKDLLVKVDGRNHRVVINSLERI